MTRPAEPHRSPESVLEKAERENARLREAIIDAIGYVRTGGPLYNAARLELLAMLNDALNPDESS